MYKIGDCVVYGTEGLRKISDIREESFLGEKKLYYVLEEEGSISAAVTYVPVDNVTLVSTIRPLLTRKEIVSAIKEAKGKPRPRWIEDSRQRTQKFKEIISRGNMVDMIVMISSIYEEGVRRNESGKRNFLSDEGIQHKVERLIYAEFSKVLDIPKEEVPEFIASV